jgi:hypothetical protein
MIALYIIGTFIVLILLLAAFTGTAWNYEKSLLINAPCEKVWRSVSTLKGLNSWNPWIRRDENITVTYTGTDGTPGAQFSWDSELKNVGAGRQTITKVTGNGSGTSVLATRIDFLAPFSGKGDGFVSIVPEVGQTRVSWRIESSMPYPMNIIKLFGRIEKNMNRDFTEGLANLKAICEQ